MPSRSEVFLDTNGLIAILNADDDLHAEAVRLLRLIESDHRPLVTTDWVLAETGNGLARVSCRRNFARAVDAFVAASGNEVVRVDIHTFHEALALYDTARDKTSGLIDCASFVVMQRRQIRDALTSDRHFSQAGFDIMLGGLAGSH